MDSRVFVECLRSVNQLLEESVAQSIKCLGSVESNDSDASLSALNEDVLIGGCGEKASLREEEGVAVRNKIAKHCKLKLIVNF